MELLERSKVRIEHWITHNDHHGEEYTIFAEQLEEAGKPESSKYIREMAELTSRCTDCLRKALKALG